MLSLLRYGCDISASFLCVCVIEHHLWLQYDQVTKGVTEPGHQESADVLKEVRRRLGVSIQDQCEMINQNSIPHNNLI